MQCTSKSVRMSIPKVHEGRPRYHRCRFLRGQEVQLETRNFHPSLSAAGGWRTVPCLPPAIPPEMAVTQWLTTSFPATAFECSGSITRPHPNCLFKRLSIRSSCGKFHRGRFQISPAMTPRSELAARMALSKSPVSGGSLAGSSISRCGPWRCDMTEAATAALAAFSLSAI